MAPHELVRDLRQAAGLTQAELADRLGMSQPAIAKLEREGANPTVRTLDRVVRATGYQLQLIPSAWSDTVDESMIRADLKQAPGERILSSKRLFSMSRNFAAGGARARGELA